MNTDSSKGEILDDNRTSKPYVDKSFRSTYKSTYNTTNKKVMIKDDRISKRGETAGISTAKQMLIQSAKKDKTAEKMSFVVGISTVTETESQQDIDELLEELLDQLDQMPELSEELLEEYTEIYLMIDPKNDGYIDAPKLFRALHTVGFDPTEAEVMDIIDAVDINKSEKIEFIELVDMMMSRDQPTLDTKELRDAFCLFDTDEDGIISLDDVKPIFSRFGYDFDDEELNDIIMVADYNKDGVVTMEDFITAVKRQSDKPYKNFDWDAIMNADDGPVGAAYEYKLEDDYFDEENEEEEEEDAQ